MKITHEWLIENGFTFVPSHILPNYYISISNYPSNFKIISLTIEFGNQYVYVREGDKEKPRHEDGVVTLFNSDFNGPLTIEFVETLYNLLKKK